MSSELNITFVPKDKIKTVRFTEREYFLIRQVSKKLGISVSDFIRQSCNTTLDSLSQCHFEF